MAARCAVAAADGGELTLVREETEFGFWPSFLPDGDRFLYLTEIGEDHCLLCPKCGYAANAEVATFVKETAHAGEEPAAIEEIDTPGLTTIEQLADHLNIPKSKTCKAVFYTATYGDEKGGTRSDPVLVAIRASPLHGVP